MDGICVSYSASGLGTVEKVELLRRMVLIMVLEWC